MSIEDMRNEIVSIPIRGSFNLTLKATKDEDLHTIVWFPSPNGDHLI